MATIDSAANPSDTKNTRRATFAPVRIRTTGHCLEFLALTLTKAELAQPWITRAAVHLCDLFEQTKELPLDCGATYHALHGLQVYREKRWGVAGK